MVRYLNFRVTLLGENPSHSLMVILHSPSPDSAVATVYSSQSLKKAEAFIPCSGQHPMELGAKIFNGFQFDINSVSCWRSSS